MPLFESETPETIKARILSRMETELQTREGSFVYDCVAPISFELWRWCMTLGELLSAFYVDADSGAYLDSHASLLGLARKSGTRAFAEITLTGKAGTQIPAGTAFCTAEGLQYELVYDAVIQETGTVTGYLQSSEVGDHYNASAGEISQIVRSISGLTGWSSGAAMGGTDPEGDAALFARIDERRKRPATSGNESHYREWALECDGVGDCKVTGLWAGPGTVRVLLVGYDRNPVDDTVVQAAAEHIETQRPVGADVTVISAVSAPVSVSAVITTNGSVDLETIREAFSSKLKDYLQSLSFKSYVVSYNRIGSILLTTDGVEDFSNLLVNGAASNVSIDSSAVPILGEVTLT